MTTLVLAHGILGFGNPLGLPFPVNYFNGVAKHLTDRRFRVESPDDFGPVYFPLANELGLLSAVTPDLHGDVKLDQHTFLTLPVAFEDLHLSRAARKQGDGGRASALDRGDEKT